MARLNQAAANTDGQLRRGQHRKEQKYQELRMPGVAAWSSLLSSEEAVTFPAVTRPGTIEVSRVRQAFSVRHGLTV